MEYLRTLLSRVSDNSINMNFSENLPEMVEHGKGKTNNKMSIKQTGVLESTDINTLLQIKTVFTNMTIVALGEL